MVDLLKTSHKQNLIVLLESMLRQPNSTWLIEFLNYHRLCTSTRNKHQQNQVRHKILKPPLLCQEIESPDITGTVDTQGSLFVGAAKPTTGSFSWKAEMTNRIGEGSANYGGILTFKSSGSSVLFGKSSTIQPKTFYILTIIKV